MSANLQDIPLAEPEILSTSLDSSTIPHETKSSSLKRFFKLGKKSLSRLERSAESIELNEKHKDSPAKTSGLSRLGTSIKGSHKSEPNVSNSTPMKPLPSAKPTLKESISSYWKQLFHRQKGTPNRQAVSAEEQQLPEYGEEPMENVELLETTTKIQTLSDEPPNLAPCPSAVDIEAALSTHDNMVDNITNEIQVLRISDEIINSTLEDSFED